MQPCFPGTVVAVNVGPITHVGVVTDKIVDGLPTVISNSMRAGGVAEEPLGLFANGGQVWLLGYIGRLSPHEVIERARSQIGKQWNLFWNCEHLVRWVHGLKPESPQLVMGAALVATLSLAVALMLSQRR